MVPIEQKDGRPKKTLKTRSNHPLESTKRQPKFTGHRRHTGGILSDIKQFDAERHYDWIVVCPHDGSSEWPWAV